MKKLINIGILSLLGMFGACIKDKGNYDYATGNPVSVSFASQTVTTYVGDTLRINPIRSYSNPADTADFDHAWYLNGELYSNKPVLEFVGTESVGYSVYYYMTDRRSGIIYKTPTSLSLNVSSRYVTGWGILYETGGHSEIGHIAVNAGLYTPYRDLYQKANGGEFMGTDPIGMRAYATYGNPILFVMQRGAEGALDVNGPDMVRKLVASQSFTREAPAGFEPVDFASFNTADLLVNKDGAVYGRFFNGAAVFTIPWLSTPLPVTGGMQVTDIWDSLYKTILGAFFYDKLNNRVLQTNAARYTTGGGITIDTLVQPLAPYPADFTPPNHLGNWQYVWGGTFHDAYGQVDAAMLIRNPGDGQLYFENFHYTFGNGVTSVLTPLKRVLFPGSSLVNSESRYVAVKSRDYLFFSGGGNNQDLYYYDVVTGSAPKLYRHFSNKITSLAVSAEEYDATIADQQIAVGLEDGTFSLNSITTDVLISGSSQELYQATGFGKIKQVIYKGYKY